jgi:ribonuclease P protein component
MAVFAVVRHPADGAGARLGVTASRKVGNAVVRARCKRRLRELFRTEDRDFAGRDVDVVINARRGFAAAPWQALVREYRRHQAKVTERLRVG